jgi:hypothetical protein
LEHGAPGSWDAAGMISPNIIFDDGTYYLFYTGYNSSNQGAIGYATSMDGYNFTKVTVNDPTLEPDGTGFDAWSIEIPVLFHDGDQWTMLYSGCQSAGASYSIGKATAATLQGPWTREDVPFLTNGSAGEWDAKFVLPGKVLQTDTGLIMYYSGGPNFSTNWQFGLAYHSGTGWVKYNDPLTNEPPYVESDPVLHTGEPGAWDSKIATFGFVSQISSGFEMFYSGVNNLNNCGLGYATSSDGITWVKSSDNPFYIYTDDPFALSNNFHVLEFPSIYITNDEYLMFYDYGLGTGYIGMATAPTLPQIIHVPADQPTIQAGIDIATTGDTVLVAEGTYYENINFLGKAITVASHFIMDADTSHISNTIIDGSQPAHPDSASVVMFISGEDTTSIISGFTITGGAGTMENALGVRSGGGIYAYNSGCKLEYNYITGNHVEGDSAGGAGLCCISFVEGNWTVINQNIINYNSSTSDGFSAFGGGMSVLINSIITNNTIEYNTCTNTVGSADGGGIEIEKFLISDFSSVIQNNIIRFNEIVAWNAMGAGIMNFGVPALIENNVIEGNLATAANAVWGGGIAAFNIPEGIAIHSNTIQNNSLDADYAYGGGVELYNCGLTTIKNNQFLQNSGIGGTVMAGGGLWIHSANDTLRIENNTMDNNTTSAGTNTVGGGVGIYITNDNEVILMNNQVGFNTALKGGGLFTFNTYNSSLINNVFNENSGTYGGAIYFRQYDGRESYPGEMQHKKNPIEKIFCKESKVSAPVLINNTFYGNDASYNGGAIYTDHSTAVPVLFNSIFYANDALNYCDNIYSIGSKALTINYCNIDTLEIYGGWIGDGNINEDPLLDLSGPHPFTLMPGSPCIDTGTPDTTGLCLPDCDIIGCCRIWDGDGDGIAVIDMGAYEFDSPMVGIAKPVVVKQEPNLTAYPNPFHSSITIEFELKSKTQVTLQVYNHLGQQVGEVAE